MTKNVRTVMCLFVACWLSACASTGKAPVELAKGETSDVSKSLYKGQSPATPQADDVVRLLEQQVASAPRDPQAYLRLGVAYRHVEKFDLALQVFQQAESLSETPHVAQNEIGILHRAQGDFEKAESIYLGILSAVPDFFDAHFNLGILYDLYLRRPLAAQKHYQAYIANAPEADERVEKWLVDLQRRHQIDASASAGVVND
ncbi:MAG: tetratricopeptide repeat protein [Gammaproteobacteria bacterium]